MLRRIRYPDGITQVAQSGFKKFDRLDHNNGLAGTPDQNVYGLPNIRMNDVFQLLEGLSVGKDKPAKFVPVDLTIFVEYPCPKCVENGLVTRRTFCNHTMRKRVGIDGISAKVFQHAPHNAFTGCDIAGQTDYILSGPVTH